MWVASTWCRGQDTCQHALPPSTGSSRTQCGVRNAKNNALRPMWDLPCQHMKDIKSAMGLLVRGGAKTASQQSKYEVGAYSPCLEQLHQVEEHSHDTGLAPKQAAAFAGLCYRVVSCGVVCYSRSCVLRLGSQWLQSTAWQSLRRLLRAHVSISYTYTAWWPCGVSALPSYFADDRWGELNIHPPYNGNIKLN